MAKELDGMAHGGDEVAWEWEDDIGWVEYGRNVSAFIENCYSNQALGDVWLGASDKDLTDYKISFSSMVQTRLLTGEFTRFLKSNLPGNR